MKFVVYNVDFNARTVSLWASTRSWLPTQMNILMKYR